MERVSIRNSYMSAPFAHVEQEEIPHEDFINNLFKIKYVVSPPGNGYDCFRTLEAIYCGAIPIIIDAPWNEPYKSLPAILTNTLFPVADYPYPEFIDLEGTTADFGYWRSKISEKSKAFRDFWS
jgi:hypothetical protein